MGRYVSISLALLLSLSLLTTLASAGEGNGEDVNPNENDVPFTIVERDSPSQDGQTWALTIQMNEDARDNGTSFQLTTQICLNSGVCDPPVTQEVTVEGGVHSISLEPPADHSYVNWRVKATYDDDSSENFPQGDWFKTWSSCYYDGDGGYEGIHSTEDGCDVPASGQESEGFMPAIGFVGVIIAMSSIAIIRRHQA